MSSANCRVHMMAAVFALIGAATPLRAQTAPSLVQGSQPSPTGLFALPEDEQVITQPAGPAPTPRHTGIKAMVKDLGSDFKHLPSKENLFWAGIGGGLALAVHPADDNVNESLVNSDFAHNFFKAGEVLGELPHAARVGSHRVRSRPAEGQAEGVARGHGPDRVARSSARRWSSR